MNVFTQIRGEYQKSLFINYIKCLLQIDSVYIEEACAYCSLEGDFDEEGGVIG